MHPRRCDLRTHCCEGKKLTKWLNVPPPRWVHPPECNPVHCEDVCCVHPSCGQHHSDALRPECPGCDHHPPPLLRHNYSTPDGGADARRSKIAAYETTSDLSHGRGRLSRCEDQTPRFLESSVLFWRYGQRL